MTPVLAAPHWHTATAAQAADPAVAALGWAILLAGVLSSLRLFALAAAARRQARSRAVSRRPAVHEPVSVIVPAPGEEAALEATIRSLLRNDHPMEIIVVDDGSADATAAVARRFALLGVRLARGPGAGAAAALNTGVGQARGRLLVLAGGSAVFAPDAIRALVQPFGDPGVAAVCGAVRVAGRDGLLGRWERTEHAAGSGLDRRLHDLAGCAATAATAVTAVRREALADVGGVSGDTLAEQTDLTMALLRAGWRVTYEDRTIAWTAGAARLRQLWRRRYRCARGTGQAMWKHRRSIMMDGSEGRLRRRALPALFAFQLLLPPLAAAVDLLALYRLVVPGPQAGGRVLVLALWLGFLFAQFAASCYLLALARERPGPLWSLPLQQLFFRQLTLLALVCSALAAIPALLGWRNARRRTRSRGPVLAPSGPARPQHAGGAQ